MRQPARHSIARRIYRAILLVSSLGMVAMVGIVIFISEDLEDGILALEMHREHQFMLANHDPAQPLRWESAEMIVAYVPKGYDEPLDLPALFRDVPPQYSAEVENGDQTWLLSATTTATGQWYLAKNITHFENRETLFERVLLAVAVAILGLSLLLAGWISRRLIRPLQHVSRTIANTAPGASMARIVMDEAHDTELHTIAATFNRFLDEMEAYVQRERTLLNMAGHELRTPIAVLSGALDVLEARGQLSARDQATLTRARRACNDMRENVNTLLALARRAPQANAAPGTSGTSGTINTTNTIDIAAIVGDVARDLHASHPGRVVLDMRAQRTVAGDPAMARMLLRNLMHNAVAHTRGEVRVTVTHHAIDIADGGAGLAPQACAVLRGEQPPSAHGRPQAATGGTGGTGGLGLYIVTLMSERLGWKLDIVHTGQDGTRIRLVPDSGGLHQSHAPGNRAGTPAQV